MKTLKIKALKKVVWAGAFCCAALLNSPNLFADNPIISQRFCADPNALVHDGRVYVYCSSDEDIVESYRDGLLNYTLISSDDMVNWTDHGLVFKVKEDSTWADNAYAPSVVFRNDKFYLYYPNAGKSIGVAVSDKPEGPFVDPLGKPLVDKSMPNCDVSWLFDPCAFIDEDGQAYLYFGGGKNEASPYGKNFRVIKLNEDMISVDGTALTIDAPHSFEGPFLHKKDGQYYLSYPGMPGNHIHYIMADNPLLTDAKHCGVVLENPSLDGKNVNRGNNSHESIIEYNGQWYMFYHDRRISNKTYKRNACVDLLEYNEDGTMKKVVVTRESVPQIKSLNPYQKVESETIDRQSGIEIEPCSEGGCMVTEISDGDWTRVSGVDFGTGAKRFQIRAAAGGKGGTIEMRLGSETGTLIGTCKIKGTGSWDTWETTGCSVSKASGVQDLYLVYHGADEPFRLNWFQFSVR
jgi:arabinoxylan arabinofuranohydrolase